MRLKFSLLLLASVCLCGCAAVSSSQQLPSGFSTGFWLWRGTAADSTWSDQRVDILFVHAGEIRKDDVNGWLPDELPAAKEYWLVFRLEQQGVPDLQVVPMLVSELRRLQDAARNRKLQVAGVQLDIDSPTSRLQEYAAFLREFRKRLPAGCGLSITALLDWFRDGTAIAEVVRETDEFVPQFYDIGSRDIDTGGSSIASRVDAARWGPVFSRFHKRFRVGISTFGRARVLPAEETARAGHLRLSYFRDLTPLDVAADPAFQLQTTRNQANELVLNYRAVRKSEIGYSRLEPGSTVQFILSTPETVQAAVENARQMNGYCAGVVFFRWSSSRETLAMQPDEVLRAAGVAGAGAKQARVNAFDGLCAAVSCVDLYLESAEPFSARPIRYRIRSSRELEYFLPEQNMPIRMKGTAELEVQLPPYCGRGRLYLGRAVSLARSAFSVEEAQ